MTVSTDYTAQEIIVVAGSKVLEDNKIVFVGTGLPMVASPWQASPMHLG